MSRDRMTRSNVSIQQVVKSGKRQRIVKETVLPRTISLSEIQPVRWRILGDKARSGRAGEQDLVKRHTLVKELSRIHIPLEMQRVGRTPITDPTQHTDRVDDGPTPTATLSEREGVIEVLQDRIASLEETVKQLKEHWSERTPVSKSQSNNRNYTLSSEIRDVASNWSRVLRGRGAGLALAERTTFAQTAMVRKDIPSCVIWPKEDGEEEDEKEHVRADHQADGVLVDRLLRNVGWTEGRNSTNAVSFESMRVSMHADDNFTDQEKKQANKLYGMDITAWTENGVKPRTLTSQLKVILENSEMTLDRVQTRVGKKNESSWRLKPI
jgi:predicted GNAT family acetyltransferase